jgi:AcrR family transcriptional regulator
MSYGGAVRASTTAAAETPRHRAAPLPPSERRAAIIAATLPLLRTIGPSVTTREIARAAAVAEGTIFSVFVDKDDLLEAAARAGFDPAPTVAGLGAINSALPIDTRLREAVELLQPYLDGVWQLMSTLCVGRDKSRRDENFFAPLAEALGRLLERDRRDLRVAPTAAGHLLLSVIVASSHPMIAGPEASSPPEIVTLFLDGARR